MILPGRGTGACSETSPRASSAPACCKRERSSAFVDFATSSRAAAKNGWSRSQASRSFASDGRPAASCVKSSTVCSSSSAPGRGEADEEVEKATNFKLNAPIGATREAGSGQSGNYESFDPVLSRSPEGGLCVGDDDYMQGLRSVHADD